MSKTKTAVFHQKTIMEGIAEAEQSKNKQHKIGWLNLPGYKGESWNPIIGCSKVSAGCKNCYAIPMARRIAGMERKRGIIDYHATLMVDKNNIARDWNGFTFFRKDHLVKPASWKKPRLVFVCSMGDLFHEGHLFEWINAVFSVMADNDQHIFIVLTKRPQRMVEFYWWKQQEHGIPWEPSENVWMGVTAENQQEANNRLHHLNNIPAAVKFVSIEPMLSPISFETALGHTLKWHAGGLKNCLSWVIVGGETSHNARPMHPYWVRSLASQCKTANVPFFFKQWGEWKPEGTIINYNFLNPKREKVAGTDVMVKVGRKQAGNLLDGVQYEEYPKF
ncbi:phage Gp37/Gp68 family protein [Prolixibacteraceae bacterium Z1-6]|uniref:Phage Gp37/Gp68 family protein n=1 Tax=Draconibacterium aestuarii TaxID=2998507 RepID=A0A9X3FC62_9BACT|nr:phage Gp37/Gp68 family protein [Prolixibacteraceae bacterium Z1-6]